MSEMNIMVGHHTPAEQVLQESGIAVKYGDTKIAWDSSKAAEIEVARAAFDKLVAKGYLAFGVKGQDKQDKQMYAFDPAAERLTLIPPIAGG